MSMVWLGVARLNSQGQRGAPTIDHQTSWVSFGERKTRSDEAKGQAVLGQRLWASEPSCGSLFNMHVLLLLSSPPCGGCRLQQKKRAHAKDCPIEPWSSAALA